MRYLILIALGLALSACSMKTDQAASFVTPEPDAAMATGTITADEIREAMSGKSWRWSSPKNSGVTLYASDGTSLVEVKGKGTTTGTWMAKDGQLCESFAPAPFLPQGVPMTCQTVTGSGTNFRVGEADFTLA
jgi:Protein of unknown function (DUF995)